MLPWHLSTMKLKSIDFEGEIVGTRALVARANDDGTMTGTYVGYDGGSCICTFRDYRHYQ